jgi:high affinity Mn2+ porin
MTAIHPLVRAAGVLGALCLSSGGAAFADDSAGPAAPSPPDQVWAVHGQATVVDQGHLAFASPFQGPNSLSPDAEGRETLDITLFAGVRPWRGAELWINPEIDQGFGLNDTLGLAGFSSAEAYKVGKANPYFRLQKLFLRQTIDLGGANSTVDGAANQLRLNETANRLVIWAGKFGVTDVFDTNDYAHDSKHDFLNWGAVDAATFDYAADAWGYTDGLAVEWYEGAWTLRLGLFDLSDVPNSERLDTKFDQFQILAETERRFSIVGRPGSLKITGFITRGRMGSFADAITLGERTDTAPSTALVRRYHGRGGLSFNLQQQISQDLGLFARGGFAGGNYEPYEFTDVDYGGSGGLSLKGRLWKRPGDTIAVAYEINGISRIHQQYLAAGGLGILIGDGRLPREGDEGILETYYDIPLGRFFHFSADYQFVTNPAYNRDRGPVSIFAGRLHAQF